MGFGLDWIFSAQSIPYSDRLYKIEITLSIQSISKEVHGCAARRVKIYGIPVKLRILPPDVRSENEPFRPDTPCTIV